MNIKYFNNNRTLKDKDKPKHHKFWFIVVLNQRRKV